jgi:4-diphosphocytidyl-2-C-methyl-D-erythritol kinase
MIVLREMAPAKINLYLHITGKRDDGYHLLDSLVAFADVNDKLEVTFSDTLTLVTEGSYAAKLPAKDNIVLKAAEALRKQYNVTKGAAITLHKNLPIGAGLGGGSADAAAAIRLLSRFWKITPGPKELHDIALALGADVLACLRATSVYMGGIGDVIETGPSFVGTYIVLINPGKPLATEKVFARFKDDFSTAVRHPHAFGSQEACIQFLQKTKNDLQNTAIEMLPEIETILKALVAQKDCQLARMSGSGATCFGMFSEALPAQNAAQELSAEYPDWWIKTATIR